MEYCEGGDMGLVIKKCKKDKDYIAEDVIWKFFMQIVLAISACHQRTEGKILHRDIKPGNVFLDGHNNVKLGDFGLSRILSKETQYASTHVGTPYYMSPEQIIETNYNEKSDIWSTGCVLYEMTALKPPFEAANQLALAKKIKTGKFDRLPLRYSEELQKVVTWMIRVNPQERPTVEDLLKIPQISLRIKEQQIKDTYSFLKKKEEDLKKKETDLTVEESKLNEKIQELSNREKQLASLESSLMKQCVKDTNNNAGGSQKSTDISCSAITGETFSKDNLVEEHVKTQENTNPNITDIVKKKIEKIQSQPFLLGLHTEEKLKFDHFESVHNQLDNAHNTVSKAKIKKPGFENGLTRIPAKKRYCEEKDES